MHALIIEDQFLVAAFIEDVLRDLGYSSFDTVDREDEAIHAGEERCPDLITNGSGVQAVRVICAKRAIPVVFISAYRAEVRKLVPDAVLIGKPFTELTLRNAVEQAVLVSLRSVDAAD